jgi:hypothetical protein
MLDSQRFVLGVLLILIFAMAARTPLDSDMWWHLRAGEDTLRMGRPMTVDTFSHTRQGERWVNHSWLSQVLLYLLYQMGGYFALGAFVALLAALSFWLVSLQMDGPVLLRAFILIFAAMTAALVWSPRPQMTSLVFFGLVGTILYLFKWRGRDYLWAFIPVFILWSNLHGGYALGLLLIGAMIVGEVVNHALFRTGDEVVEWRRIGRLVLWGILAGVVVVVNPNETAMWMIPFKTVGVSVLQEFISEWTSPDFHQFVQQPFLWLLFATLAVAALSKRRIDGTELVSVIGFAYLALLARRNYGPFAMVAAPVLSRHLYALLGEWGPLAVGKLQDRSGALRKLFQRYQQRSLSAKAKKILNVVILLVLSLIAVVKLYAVTEPEFVEDQLKHLYPVEAVQWIEENQPAGELFNEYNWGGYLTWNMRAYPVFVDGRTDLYDDELLREYLEIRAGGEEYAESLQEYSVKLLLIEPGSGLAAQLESDGQWEAAYQDEQGMVYVHRSP